MPLTTVLFDLDGTLLPMDQDVFAKTYFMSIAKDLAPLGYEPEAVVKSIWAGTKAMIKNTGEKTNEAVFWETFAGIFGDRVYNDQPTFDRFYVEHFDGAYGPAFSGLVLQFLPFLHHFAGKWGACKLSH